MNAHGVIHSQRCSPGECNRRDKGLSCGAGGPQRRELSQVTKEDMFPAKVWGKDPLRLPSR